MTQVLALSLRSLGLFCLLISGTLLPAQDWPQWRGAFFNGSADVQNLPARWGAGENIRWAAAMPGPGHSTPIIVGQQVFVTSTDLQQEQLHALCLNTVTGKILWQQTIPAPKTPSIPYSNLAASSPACDGQRVVFIFGSGDFFCCDVQGKMLWQRSLEKDFGPLSQLFKYSASPIFCNNRLYLSVIRDNVTRDGSVQWEKPLDSFLLCVDPATGKDLWKIDRPSDATGEESRDSYTTPVPLVSEKETLILTLGAGFLTGNDWQTGEEKLRLKYFLGEKYRQRVVPTPIVTEDFIIAIKPRYGAMFALPKQKRGPVSFEEIAWSIKEFAPDTPSPLYYQGRLYYLHDSKKKLTCADPKSGKVIWTGDLKGSLFHASPTAGDGKIYCLSQDGTVSVVQAGGDSFKLIAQISMGEMPCSASIAIADQSLFIRTAKKLYRVAQTKRPDR